MILAQNPTLAVFVSEADCLVKLHRIQHLRSSAGSLCLSTSKPVWYDPNWCNPPSSLFSLSLSLSLSLALSLAHSLSFSVALPLLWNSSIVCKQDSIFGNNKKCKKCIFFNIYSSYSYSTAGWPGQWNQLCLQGLHKVLHVRDKMRQINIFCIAIRSNPCKIAHCPRPLLPHDARHKLCQFGLHLWPQPQEAVENCRWPFLRKLWARSVDSASVFALQSQCLCSRCSLFHISLDNHIPVSIGKPIAIALRLQLPSLQLVRYERVNAVKWIWVLLRVRHLPHQQVRRFPCILQLFQRLHLNLHTFQERQKCKASETVRLKDVEGLFMSPSCYSYRSTSRPSLWLEGCAVEISNHWAAGITGISCARHGLALWSAGTTSAQGSPTGKTRENGRPAAETKQLVGPPRLYLIYIYILNYIDICQIKSDSNAFLSGNAISSNKLLSPLQLPASQL